MKTLLFPTFVLSTFILIYSCSSGSQIVSSEDVSKIDSTAHRVNKVDSASYQRGIEHSVNEKLLKKYKQKNK